MSLIGDMTEAVVIFINKGTNFKESFARVAHQHNIWHYKDKAQYNYTFSQVMAAVRKKIGQKALSEACKNQAPSIARVDYKRLAANDID